MPDIDIPDLKRLDAEMYTAPWYAHEGGVTAGELRHGVGVVKIAAFRSEAGSVDYYDAFAVKNSHGAANLRNALPALIAIAEQVAEKDKRIAELEADARRYRALKSTAQVMGLHMDGTGQYRVPTTLLRRARSFDEACDALADQIDSAARGD